MDGLARLRKRVQELELQNAELAAKNAQLAEPQPAVALAAARSVDVDGDGTHALGKLMRLLRAKVSVISAPERDLNGNDVMIAVERAAGTLSPNLLAAYDFQGSTAARDCKEQQPDCGLQQGDWGDKDKVRTTQWFRYWVGKARGTLGAVLASAAQRDEDLRVFAPQASHNPLRDGRQKALKVSRHTRLAFAVSLSGGPITQVEKEALPKILSGTVADISTRELDLGGEVKVVWLHFETLEDFLKALQGYGGIDLREVDQRNKFGLAGEWKDGDYKPEHDLLTGGKAGGPDQHRSWLMEKRPQSEDALDSQLHSAINAGAVERVEELLRDGANASSQSKANEGAIYRAVARFDAPLIRALLRPEAGSSELKRATNKDGETPHAYAKRLGNGEGLQALAKKLPDIQKRIVETITLLDEGAQTDSSDRDSVARPGTGTPPGATAASSTIEPPPPPPPQDPVADSTPSHTHVPAEGEMQQLAAPAAARVAIQQLDDAQRRELFDELTGENDFLSEGPPTCTDDDDGSDRQPREDANAFWERIHRSSRGSISRRGTLGTIEIARRSREMAMGGRSYADGDDEAKLEDDARRQAGYEAALNDVQLLAAENSMLRHRTMQLIDMLACAELQPSVRTVQCSAVQCSAV